MAAGHVAKLATLPAEMITPRPVFGRRDRGRRELVRAFLLEHGDHIEGMRLLAQIGMKLDVLDDAELLLESVFALAPIIRPRATTTRRCCCKRHKHAQALRAVEKLLTLEPEQPRLSHHYATATSAWATTRRPARLPASCWRAPQAADLHLSIAHALKTIGSQPEAIDPIARRAPARALAMPIGASPISRPIASPTRRSRTCAPRKRRRRPPRRPLSSVLCARQGARGPRRVRASRSAITSAATRSRKARAVSARVHRAQCAAAGRRLHARILRGAPRLGCPSARSDLYRRIAALRLDLDRADSRLALAGRRHDGAADIPRMALELQGREPDRRAALPAHARGADRRAFRSARRAISR